MPEVHLIDKRMALLPRVRVSPFAGRLVAKRVVNFSVVGLNKLSLRTP